VDQGNTVLVIEHNLDVIKTADWLVDMGPEGGSGGGQVVAVGTPEEVARTPGSHTGGFLRELFERAGHPYQGTPERTVVEVAEEAPKPEAKPKRGRPKKEPVEA
jgi:excinuclease ABC subunit A